MAETDNTVDFSVKHLITIPFALKQKYIKEQQERKNKGEKLKVNDVILEQLNKRYEEESDENSG
tara:strand:- start:103 stop:294 length:192 start_codon:yes stop_codon:yes gene_type:complete